MNKNQETKQLHTALYTATAILAALAMVFAALDYCKPNPLCQTLAITFFTTFYHFFIRFFVSTITYLPLRNLQNTDNFWFRQKKFEKKLYAKIRVQKWKKYMPTYNPPKFDLRRRPPQEIVAETCRAEINHLLIIPLCLFPIFWSLFWGELPVFLITSVLSALAEVPFIIIQRYNRPRLQKAAAQIAARKNKFS